MAKVTPPKQDRSPARAGSRIRGLLGLSFALVVVAVVAVVVVALQGSGANPLRTNPELDPGTPLAPRPAPNFTLTDQFGQPITLSQFRGKVVVLSFDDSRCLGVCPLTTAEMVAAKRMLGSAGSQVQLLGVDANPTATAVADVRAYSAVHGLTRSWYFLTGPLAQLRSVWHDYGIEARVIHGQIDHTPAVFLINRSGQLVRVFLTPMDYASHNQQAQVLAESIARLLPGNPTVHSHLSYQPQPPLAAGAPVTLGLAGGGRLTVGAGTPRLLVFFATWDREVENLAANLTALNQYQDQARQLGLPQPVAVDLAPTEPSPTALEQFLATLATPLAFPVAVDSGGRFADHYGVEEAPWFVLVGPHGEPLWYDDAAAEGWPTTPTLVADVRGALKRATASTPAAALAGSPPPLAGLHAEAGKLLPGGVPALKDRLAALRGYPVVVNLWASWCTPCQREVPRLIRAALRHGRTVAFLGADVEDPAGSARSFLSNHPLSYPSYQTTLAQVEELAPVTGLPDTLYYAPDGRLVHLQIGEYPSQAALEADIERYAR